jgi:tetratricopeptide (TPR) repeat protein
MACVAAGLTVLVRLFKFFKFLSHRRDEAVLKVFYERLEKEPMNALLWFNLGHVFLSMGRTHKALLCAERLLSIDPEKAELLQWGIEHPEFRPL